jgi:hypothetical protein
MGLHSNPPEELIFLVTGSFHLLRQQQLVAPLLLAQ